MSCVDENTIPVGYNVHVFDLNATGYEKKICYIFTTSAQKKIDG